MTPESRSRIQLLFQAIAIYSGVAWAGIEIVQFAVTNYGLSRALLDSSVLIAFGGGAITATLTWYHSVAGRQKPVASEVLLLTSMVIVVIIGLIMIGTRTPTYQFDRLTGYTIAFEIEAPDPSNPSGNNFSIEPLLGMEAIECGAFHLSPKAATIEGPAISLASSGYPAMYCVPDGDEFGYIKIVLPFKPVAIEKMLRDGRRHQSGVVTIEDLTLEIKEPFDIFEQESTAIIKLVRISD